MSVSNTHFGAESISKLMKSCKSVYFIGIGGINMSSLAHITHSRGYSVAGSDRTKTALTSRLEKEGIRVNYCHSEENAQGYDVFVYTVAISEDNAEYSYALKMGKPCISRADYMGYIMLGYNRRVGISGMHGKSTCTAMCAEILMADNADPTVLCGAELASMGGAYRIGKGESFVFEACEYMDSFLDFNPNIAVILNIEMDHVDYFKSMEQIKASFAEYAALTGNEGYAVYNADDSNVNDALKDYRGNRLSFGIKDENADMRAVNIGCKEGKHEFDVMFKGELFSHVQLNTFGRHNIYNALAAACACMLCGVGGEAVAEGLARFCGARRRMEFKGCINGGAVYDDYAHHPTEITASLNAARGMTEKRLFCVYQPHTYSRTYALFDDFARAFDVCDRVIFTDIYAAREQNIYGISSRQLAEKVGSRAEYAESFEAAAEILQAELSKGDTAIVMGAGDVYKVFDSLHFDLKKKGNGESVCMM